MCEPDARSRGAGFCRHQGATVDKFTHCEDTAKNLKPFANVEDVSDADATCASGKDRLIRVFELSYDCLRKKINGGSIRVDNEASLQLHFAAILKLVGELHELDRHEYFSIDLEVPVNGAFIKSGSSKARVDIVFSYNNDIMKQRSSCAVELKFFKKENQREPNNRYDVFSDIHNLENYGNIADCCFMVVATNHEHYISQKEYSSGTAEFDFRDGTAYEAGTELTYRTGTPYGDSITLKRSYAFRWDKNPGRLNFLKLEVDPISKKMTYPLGA